ncbi:hypothetical protein Tco_0389882 [Tanacetum coccineum]
MESFTQKNLRQAAGSPDEAKVSNPSVTEQYDLLSPKLSDWSRRGSEDMLDCLPDGDIDDMKGLASSLPYKTRFGTKSNQGMTTSSAGSITPRSPLLKPRTSQIDLLLIGNGSYSEHDDLPQAVQEESWVQTSMGKHLRMAREKYGNDHGNTVQAAHIIAKKARLLMLDKILGRVTGTADPLSKINLSAGGRHALPEQNFRRCTFIKRCEGSEDQLSTHHQLMIKGLADSTASASNLRDIQVRDIVKEVKDHLKTLAS